MNARRSGTSTDTRTLHMFEKLGSEVPKILHSLSFNETTQYMEERNHQRTKNDSLFESLAHNALTPGRFGGATNWPCASLSKASPAARPLRRALATQAFGGDRKSPARAKRSAGSTHASSRPAGPMLGSGNAAPHLWRAGPQSGDGSFSTPNFPKREWKDSTSSSHTAPSLSILP